MQFADDVFLSSREGFKPDRKRNIGKGVKNQRQSENNNRNTYQHPLHKGDISTLYDSATNPIIRALVGVPITVPSPPTLAAKAMASIRATAKYCIVFYHSRCYPCSL
jgi:hypothetical protein